MSRQHASRIWHAVRQKTYFRNITVGAVFFIMLYGFRIALLPQDSFLSSSPHTHLRPSDVSLQVWDTRAQQVKQAFLHAYRGYERYAAPSDELKPLSNVPINNFNGWGVSAFDSLDTMLLMGLDHEFQETLPLIASTTFTVPDGEFVPFFETVIRYLGGLLSGYALSERKMLLTRADELARVLDPVFHSKSGFPVYGVNPASGKISGPDVGVLAEMASLQLEYAYLAKLTGKKEHFIRANTVMDAFAHADLRNTGGMFPNHWNLTSGKPHNSHLSVGAEADSAHEYLLKYYLMTAKTDNASLEMYLRATTHILTNLLYLSPNRHLLYVTDTHIDAHDHRVRPSHVLEHLSCFLPGLLALGAHTIPFNNLSELGIEFDKLGNFSSAGKRYTILSKQNFKTMHLWAAEGLAETCWLTYADQPSGLGPDEVVMKTGSGNLDVFGINLDIKELLWIEAMERWKGSGGKGLPPGLGEKKPVVYSEMDRLLGSGKGRDYVVKKTEYLLRPETIESMYIMWKVTGNAKWRERGWKIFEAIERETKTPTGYTAVKSVEVSPAAKADSMPSYFLAETLKYLYLLFIDDDPIPLDKWVFNTEAHPFPVFEWSEREKALFGIK